MLEQFQQQYQQEKQMKFKRDIEEIKE